MLLAADDGTTAYCTIKRLIATVNVRQQQVTKPPVGKTQLQRFDFAEKLIQPLKNESFVVGASAATEVAASSQ
jgi:hypothetical protein